MAGLSPGVRNSVSSVFYGEDQMDGDPIGSPSLTWRLIQTVFDKITAVEGDAPPEAFEA